MARRQLHLGLFIYPGGHHIGGWRHPSVAPREILGFAYYQRAAQAAERGKFDLFFVGDMLAAREKDGPRHRPGRAEQHRFDLDQFGTCRGHHPSRAGGDAVHHLQ